jgi:hypothetical protein
MFKIGGAMNFKEIEEWYNNVSWHDLKRLTQSKVLFGDRYVVTSQDVDFFMLGIEEVLGKMREERGEIMKYYKVLGKGGKSCNGGNAEWSLPKDGKPGDWMPEITEELIPCENGYHLCREKDLIEWLNEEIYEAEFEGEIIESENKVVVRKARLLRKLETWNEKTARLFVADCAERVLPFFGKRYPDDNRPRLAIAAAREYANGKISAATMAATRAATSAAASAATSVAAWAAEIEWQTKRLLEYLEEKER